MDALVLFRADMGTYVRAYAFLSQIFDYGNTEFEKRAIFYRHLLRLLKFESDRLDLDLSQVILTHHNLKVKQTSSLKIDDKEYPKLDPMQEIGAGEVREKEKAFLKEIIAKVNDLFTGELTDDDKLVYVNNVIKGKLLESEVLIKQAASNTKEQFSNSPDLSKELTNAIISALDAHTEMSTQALNSDATKAQLLRILLDYSHLYEELRKAASA
ncbi:MAG: hypothetical protein R3C03_02585 [Pirellulaceae bacterium]